MITHLISFPHDEESSWKFPRDRSLMSTRKNWQTHVWCHWLYALVPSHSLAASSDPLVSPRSTCWEYGGSTSYCAMSQRARCAVAVAAPSHHFSLHGAPWISIRYRHPIFPCRFFFFNVKNIRSQPSLVGFRLFFSLGRHCVCSRPYLMCLSDE